MAVEQLTLTYRVQIEYSYDTNDLPNISMLAQRQLIENLESALDFCRQGDQLDHEDITADWIGDVVRMTVSS